MPKIADKLTQVKHRIQQAACLSGRNPDEITLLAVSKKHSDSVIMEAYAAGQRDFGENYLQEALHKIQNIAEKDICWHFIGPIQGNKCKKIAEKFHWVHAVDRLSIGQKLSKHRLNTMPKLNVCLQVNIDREASKSGVSPEDSYTLAEELAQLPNITLRGLMAIPLKKTSAEGESAFKRLRLLFSELRLRSEQLGKMDTLSMGMSGDLQEAVSEGSTLVRIGTDVFGPRPG